MTVNLSLETATKMFNSGDESLKAFALENYPELNPLPTKWEDLRNVNGYYVSSISIIEPAAKDSYPTSKNGNIFASSRQANAAISMAKLSQLKAVYNDDWEANWADSETKFCISFYHEALHLDLFIHRQAFLAFKTEKLAREFMKHFHDLIMEAKPLL